MAGITPDSILDEDFGAQPDGYLCKSSGTYASLKDNRAASTDPGATDDSAAGYGVGSQWVNIVTPEVFICVDDTASAAVWKSMTKAGTVLQSKFAELTVDASTTSNTWVDIGVSITLTTTGGDLIIQNTSSAANDDGNDRWIQFQILLDDVALRGYGAPGKSAAGDPESGGLIYKKTGVSAGSHTVKIQWRGESGTSRCRPATKDDEHCCLLVKEVSV